MGGMALGGSLLFLAARSLLDTSRPLRVWGVAALAVAGGVAWALGTYQKETSICVLPLLAGVAIAGWAQARRLEAPEPRAEGGTRRARRRRRAASPARGDRDAPHRPARRPRVRRRGRWRARARRRRAGALELDARGGSGERAAPRVRSRRAHRGREHRPPADRSDRGRSAAVGSADLRLRRSVGGGRHPLLHSGRRALRGRVRALARAASHDRGGRGRACRLLLLHASTRHAGGGAELDGRGARKRRARARGRRPRELGMRRRSCRARPRDERRTADSRRRRADVGRWSHVCSRGDVLRRRTAARTERRSCRRARRRRWRRWWRRR